MQCWIQEYLSDGWGGGRACDSDAQMGNDSASMFAKIMGVVCGRSCIWMSFLSGCCVRSDGPVLCKSG